MDEHNEYISQLPDTDTGTITNNHNNIDRHDAGAGPVADRVGVAVAAHLGPLLQGIVARLDLLTKVAARVALQTQPQHSVSIHSPEPGRAAIRPTAGSGGHEPNANLSEGVAGRNGTPHKTQQYEDVGGPAEAGLRREISRSCAEVDRVHFGGEPGKANKAIFCTFGFKSRSQMGLEELGEVLAWAREEWPLA